MSALAALRSPLFRLSRRLATIRMPVKVGALAGERVAENDVAKSTKKSARSKGGKSERELELQASQRWAECDLRKELDPQELPGILQRISDLTMRARALSDGKESLAPGLEVIEKVASDLSGLLPCSSSKAKRHRDRRAEVRERHKGALDRLWPVDPILAAHLALEEVTVSPLLGMSDEQFAKTWSDERAVQAIRCQLQGCERMLPSVTGEQILESVREYRKPRAPVGGGRPGRGDSTEKSRALAALRLVDNKPDDIKDHSRRLRTAISRMKSK